MRNRALGVFAIGLIAAVPQCLIAANAAEAKAGSLRDILDASGIKVNGYVDTAYSYLNTTGLFASGSASRVFDTEPSSFNLHQAALFVAYQPDEGLGGLLNITASRDARVIKSFDTTTNDFDVTQAFLQYKQGNFTLAAGKFVTLAGAEVINSTANFQYSHSFLFGFAEPIAHTGARLTFTPSEGLTLIAGLNNGWDQLKDANDQKTVELGIGLVANKQFTLLAQAYYGTEQVNGFTDTVSGTRSLFDVVATYNVTDKLSLILNVDIGEQENFVSLDTGQLDDAKFKGVAGYLNYSINDQWRLSLRSEYFDDEDGYRTGIAQILREATVTLAYLPSSSLEVRIEARHDRSSTNAFVDDDGGAQRDQQSFALEGVFKF